jgi:hypothetical protein
VIYRRDAGSGECHLNRLFALAATKIDCDWTTSLGNEFDRSNVQWILARRPNLRAVTSYSCDAHARFQWWSQVHLQDHPLATRPPRTSSLLVQIASMK